eukprot:gnl/TRDRNA2_/TRDRNA2_68931_c0_seq2.p1 gnl/TRDRNA2_/TRDRNA2_68931_c0~~gnl/TRDRNA2_/TRDRNA2_68931_c0_seq2.p1  ORF type:complete len:471 (+),score=79.80 gnl/TRDRNA2_/TRDRNA2_68931_c0_seq2:71-1483(+)
MYVPTGYPDGDTMSISQLSSTSQLPGSPISAGPSMMMSPQDAYKDRIDRLETEIMRLASKPSTPMNGQQFSPQKVSMPPPGTPSREHQELVVAYNELMKAHADLLKIHKETMAGSIPVTSELISRPQSRANTSKPTHITTPTGNKKPLPDAGKIGIVRLDGANYSAPNYAKKAVLGDAASKATFENAGNKVFYQRAEGYTFTVCKFGWRDPKAYNLVFEKEGVVKIRGREGDPTHMYIPNRRGGARNQPRPRRPTRTERWLDATGREIGVQYIYDSHTVCKNVIEALKELETVCEVDCISSACGFMGNVQKLCAENCSVPCLMSSLELLPLCDMIAPHGTAVIVLTANSAAFNENYDELVRPSWKILRNGRLEIVGLQHAEGFGEEVSAGTTVDVDRAMHTIVSEVRAAIDRLRPKRVAAILSECTELPGYTNTLRSAFNLPVYDAITACNILLHSLVPREEYKSHASYG